MTIILHKKTVFGPFLFDITILISYYINDAGGAFFTLRRELPLTLGT